MRRWDPKQAQGSAHGCLDRGRSQPPGPTDSQLIVAGSVGTSSCKELARMVGDDNSLARVNGVRCC